MEDNKNTTISSNDVIQDIQDSIQARQIAYKDYVIPGFNTEDYALNRRYPEREYEYNNYAPSHWVRDAFTSWAIGMNQAQYGTDMGKFMLAEDDLNDLDYAEQYLDLIDSGTIWDSISPDIINGYTRALQDLGFDSNVDEDTLRTRIQNRRQELLNEQKEYLEDANTDLQDIQDYQDKWEISDYYKYKEAQPTEWSLDTMLYKLPGVFGSSSSSMGWQALSLVSGIVGSIGSLAAAPATGGLSVAAYAAVGAGLAGNLYGSYQSGKEENAAEVYENLKSAITQKMTKSGGYGNLIKAGRTGLKNKLQLGELNVPGITSDKDIDKMTDDQVMDAILRGEIDTENAELERTVNNYLPATEELFLRDMATTIGTDAITSIFEVMPMGFFSKSTKIGRGITSAINATKESVLGSNLTKKLDTIAHFGLSDEVQNVLKRRNIDFVYSIAKRNTISALSEGPGEEGVQYLNGQKFIQEKYGKDTPNWVEAYLGSLIDKAKSTWAFISPFDAAQQYDSEWLENSRSGVLMGLFNLPNVAANARDIAQNSRNNQALRSVRESLLRNIFEDKTQWNKAKFYAEQSTDINSSIVGRVTSGTTAINNAFEAYSKFMPEEFTEQMWNSERDMFNRIRNLNKSKTVRKLAEQRGIVKNSKDYITYVALLEYKRQKYEEAKRALFNAETEVSKKIEEIKKSHPDIHENLFNIARSNASMEAVDRYLKMLDDQEEDAKAAGLKINKRDVERARQIAKKLKDKQQKALKEMIDKDAKAALLTLLEISDAQEDLIQAELESLVHNIDYAVEQEDYSSLNVDRTSKDQSKVITNNDEKVETVKLSSKEIEDMIDYSKKLIKRYQDVDTANEGLQQDLRTGAKTSMDVEQPVKEKRNEESDLPFPPPTQPTPKNPPSNPTPAGTAPAAPAVPPPVAPVDGSSDPFDRTKPETKPEPKPEEPAASEKLPPMPGNAVIPGVSEEGSQNASTSDSQASQDTKTPAPEQQPTSKPESSTGPENASTEGSVNNESQPEQPKQPQQPEQPSTPESDEEENRFISTKAYQEARERMRKRLGNLNVGLDLSALHDLTIIGAYHLENGARKFVDFAKAVIADLGENIKPYLASAYEGARRLPNNPYRNDMDDTEYVDKLTANNNEELDKILSGSKPNQPTQEQIVEIQNKVRDTVNTLEKELADPKYNVLNNQQLFDNLRQQLQDLKSAKTTDISFDDIAKINEAIDAVQESLEQLYKEYNDYINSRNDDILNTDTSAGKYGYSLLVRKEDQVKAVTLLNAPDLFENSEFDFEIVDDYVVITVNYNGESIRFTLLDNRRDPQSIQNYPKLVEKLKAVIRLQKQYPDRYKITPVGFSRTSGDLIKRNPGEIVPMTSVSFWNYVVGTTNPYEINETNFILTVVDQEGNIRRNNDMFGVRSTTNKGFGDIIWIARIPRKEALKGYIEQRILINPTRLGKLKGASETLVEAIRQYLSNENQTTPFIKDNQDSPFTPRQVIDLLSYFDNVNTFSDRVSPEENRNRANKRIYIDAANNNIVFGDKAINITDFLQSEEVRNSVVQILNDPQYGFHIPIREETLSGCWGANNTDITNPMAPLKQWFINNPNRSKYTLFEGMTFTTDMVGLGKGNPRGMNWLGFLVVNNLINSGASDLINRVYVRDFVINQSDNNLDTQTENTINNAVDNSNSNTDNNPFGDAFGEVPIGPAFTSSDPNINVMTATERDKARKVIANLTDLSEEDVEIIDSIIDMAGTDMYVMGQARIDSIVLSGHNIPGIEYHEAWHRICNLLMSPKQRDKVFNQVRKKYGKNLTEKEIDEILAERFREFQLQSAEVIDYTTTNLFKKVFNFIRTWFRIGNLRLARIYYQINTGRFINIKPSAENIARFKALYSNKGPNFTFNGAEFKQFPNRFALNKSIDSLMYFLFYKPGSKIAFYKDASALDFQSLFGMLKRSNKPQLQELCDDDNGNWSAVKKAIYQRLEQLSIRVIDKQEEDMRNDADSGNLAKVNMDDYVKASYEIDALGNLTADVKFFLSTIPMYHVDDKTNTFKPVLDEITGLPKFYPIRYIWNVCSSDLGKCASFEELIQKVDELMTVDPIYAGLKWKLNKYKELLNSEDEQVMVDTEAAITRILTALRKQKLTFDTVSVRTDEETGLYNIKIVDNTVDYKTRVLPSMWSQNFLLQSELFDVTTDSVKLTEEGKKTINKVLNAFANVKNAFQKNNGIITINGQSFNLHLPANQQKLITYLCTMMSYCGIAVDTGSIIELIKDPSFGSDLYSKLYNLCCRTNLHYGGLTNLFNLIKRVVDATDLSNIDGENKVTIDNLYNNSGFVSELAAADTRFHANHDNLQAIGAGNNLLYTKADNNFISDRTQELNTDSDVVQNLLDHPWNHYEQEIQDEDGEVSVRNVTSSLILESIQQGKKISLEVFQNFKTDNFDDLGSDYHQINDIEDYVAKLTLSLNGRLLFPTIEAKKTYYVINGVDLPYSGVVDVVTIPGLGYDFIFSNELLDRMINYFYADYNAAMNTIGQLTEGSPNYVPESERITNYHTPVSYYDEVSKTWKTTSPNGTRMRIFRGMYRIVTDKNGNRSYEYINFTDPSKSSEEILKQAKDLFFNQSHDIKRSIVNKILSEKVKKELQYCIDIGLIKGDINDYTSFTSDKLDVTTLTQRSSKYKNNSHAMGIIDIIADGTNRASLSFIEVQKVFVGDPAFFKWEYNSKGLVQDSIDIIKRHGGLNSTGMNNRLDLDNFDPFYKAAELKDYKQGSDQLDYLLNITSEGYLREFVKKERGEGAIVNVGTNTLKERYPELWNAAQIRAKSEFGGYAKGINVADAAVYITPEFYAKLMRATGEWGYEVREAYKILMDNTADWYTQTQAYATVIKASFRALKYVAYGTRFEHGNAVPYFNKMALFPLFKQIATGDMQALYERMTREGDGIDMVMFESAVKVGSKNPKSVTDLNNLTVYTQNMKYLRQQLSTKGHEAPHVVVGTQMLKVALGNLDLNCTYNGIRGETIFRSIMNCINELSNRGVKRLNDQFLDKNGKLDLDKFSKRMNEYFSKNPANDNLTRAFVTVTDPVTGEKKLRINMSAASDSAFLESILASIINSETIDISMPGGAFIQRSAFGVYDSKHIVSDAALNGGKKLKMIDEKDGSMHAIISITMFRDIIPDFENKTFAQQREWLIKHNIIGENSKPIGIGYRIPTQAQASISALKFVDVLPAVMEDTIILPEEFTKLTGSDFDIDKLYVIRYAFDKEGRKIEYNNDVEISKNSEDAVKNLMIDMYIKVLTSSDYQQQMKLSIDNATEMLKDVLDEIQQFRQTPEFRTLDSYTMAYQLSKKSEYTIGKAGIGPFALNNAHHVLTQLVRFRMADTAFNHWFMTDRLDRQYDTDGSGNRILDWLSGLINAFVDIAKDPFIIHLNVNAFTYNMTSYLIRMGMGRKTFYFLNQPIIIELAREIINVRGNFGKPKGKTQSELEQDVTASVAAKYDIDLQECKDLAKAILEDNSLESYDIKNAFELFHKVIKNEATEEEKRIANQYALTLWYAFSPAATAVSSLVKYSKIDTKKHGKTFAEWFEYYRGMNNLRKNPNFYSVLIDETLGLREYDVDHLFWETFLSTKTENTIDWMYNFGSVFLRSNKLFLRNVDNTFCMLPAGSMNQRALSKIVQSYESAVKALYFNMMCIDTGRYDNPLQMFYGNNSVPRRLQKFKLDVKKGKYPDLVDENNNITNALLNFLYPNILKTNSFFREPDFIDVRVSTNLDLNEQNELIYAWEELLLHPNKEVRELAEDLIYYAFYTSGDNKNPNSFFNCVPDSWRDGTIKVNENGYFPMSYTQYIQQQLDSYEELMSKLYSDETDQLVNDDDYLHELMTLGINSDDIYLNNWQDDSIVPTVPESTFTEVLGPDGLTMEKVNRLGIVATTPIKDTNIHPYILFINDTKYDSELHIKSNRDGIYPLYVKIKYTSSKNPNGVILYKWVGNIFRNKKLSDGKTVKIAVPLYTMVNKKGFSYRGHKIVEYGLSFHFPFNEFIDGVYQPITPKDIASRRVMEYVAKSRLPESLQKRLIQDLSTFTEVSFFYNSNYDDQFVPDDESYSALEVDSDGNTSNNMLSNSNSFNPFTYTEPGLTEQEAEEMRNKTVIVRPQTINVWAGSNENTYFSNFAIRPFTYDGRTFQSVEQAFQAMKYYYSDKTEADKQLFEKIVNTTNGKELKALGRRFTLHTDVWDRQSESLLGELMYQSFMQNPEAANALLATGNALFTHNNPNNSTDKYTFLFPRLLANVRDRLSQDSPTLNQKTSQPQQQQSNPEIYERAIEQLSEEWSQKEGWSKERFYQKVLPKLDEAWVLEFTSFPNPMYKYELEIQMNYSYGNQKREGVQSDSTLEAIKNNERTQTTRFESDGKIDYYKQNAKPFARIRFYNKNTGEETYGLVDKFYKLTDRLNEIQIDLDPNILIMHSGGAVGGDSVWSKIAEEFGIPNTPDRQKHYYYEEKTPIGNLEISELDYEEGRTKVAEAAKANLGYQYNAMSDSRLIRNWSQVKYSDAVFAVGHLVKPGERIFPNQKNDTRTAKQVAVAGGTGYAVEMAIQAGKPVYVYDQERKQWYKNIDGKWSKSDVPTLTKNFAGIGTRQINQDGINAIRSVFEKTFNRQNPFEGVQTEWSYDDVMDLFGDGTPNIDRTQITQQIIDILQQSGYPIDQISNIVDQFYQEVELDTQDPDVILNKIYEFICKHGF